MITVYQLSEIVKSWVWHILLKYFINTLHTYTATIVLRIQASGGTVKHARCNMIKARPDTFL